MKLLRSKLKKEQVNLLMSKNNVFRFLVFLGIIVLTLYVTNDTPEENMSSGVSFAVNTKEIDNYANVLNYNYILKSGEKSGVTYSVLKDMDFSFAEYEFDLAQYPQGICFTDEYLFITSYSSEAECLGELKIFDKEDGEYLLTLCMDEDSHLGGITYDGENVWVCNSANMTIERISYDFICLLAEQNKGEVLNICHLVDEYSVENVPSSITFYNGRLWIATHNVLFPSNLVTYYYDKKTDSVKSLSEYTIPPQVQGITFGEDEKVYLSTSYGRQKSSYLLVYKSIFRLINSSTNFCEVIEMPPCSEGIVINNNNLYVLFESANETYLKGSDGNGSSISPLDKILIINNIENR